MDGRIPIADRVSIGKDVWVRFASCRDSPLDFFSTDARVVKACKAVCCSCPAQRSCLLDALQNGEEWGVWGGRDEKERRAIKKAARRNRVPVEVMVREYGKEGR